MGGVFGVAISKVIEELLTAKSSANRRARYIKSLRYYLEQFAASHQLKAIGDFTTNDIEAWMAKYSSAWSRQTWLNRLSTLFSFAVRRGHIPSNPCDRIERVTTDCNPPKILTPAQADLLLKTVSGICRPYLILAVFAGIRPEEIMRLNWTHINLDTNTVQVEGKTRRRRIVRLEPRAAALLADCVLKTGPVTPSLSTLRRFKIQVRKALGVPRFPQDLFRHTFASYALALHGDAGKVATGMGNSSAVLLRHYHEPVSQKDCNFFWSVCGHTKYDPVGLAQVELPLQSSICGQIDRKDQPENYASHKATPPSQGEARTTIPQPDRLDGLRNHFGDPHPAHPAHSTQLHPIDAPPKPIATGGSSGKMDFAGKNVIQAKKDNTEITHNDGVTC